MSDLEERVRTLEIEAAVRDEKIDVLTKALEANTVAVQRLTEKLTSANAASKTILYVLLGLGGLVTFFSNLGTIVHLFRG